MNSFNMFNSIIAGILQGATELLPVSSSGHLLILSKLTDSNLEILSVAILHLGTLASILIVFRKELKLYLDQNFLFKIFLSSIPAGILGFLIEEVLNLNFNNSNIIVFTLIFWGILLIVADRISDRRIHNAKSSKESSTQTLHKLKTITFKQAIFIGLGQCLALIPGTSRSGVTTIAGIFSGLSADTALKYSFLSGIPLISLSGVYALVKLIFTDQLPTSPTSIGIGTLVSFGVGLLAAFVLTKYINRNILTICGIYRILIATGFLIFV
jgi:undecaprenyl-diphosphatase